MMKGHNFHEDEKWKFSTIILFFIPSIMLTDILVQTIAIDEIQRHINCNIVGKAIKGQLSLGVLRLKFVTFNPIFNQVNVYVRVEVK